MITKTERYSRQVVQAVVQNPLMCWPEVFVIRDEAFHKNTQPIWGIVRDLVTVHLRDGENVTLTPELVIAALEQLNVKADTSWLCLPVSESAFLEAVHNLHPKTLTSGEMQIRLRLKTQCERIAAKSVGAAGSDDWPELMPISGPEPESIVPEDFPECVAGIVRAASDCLEVPCELPALLALGVLATACQKRFQILSAGGHVEPLSLFLLPALNPGERKTAAKNLIVRPIETFERQLQAAVGDELRENESKRQTAFKRIEHLRGVAAKDKDASAREIAQREIDELEREMPPARYKPQLICDDCTPEHVATLLSRNGERMAVLSDEAGIFDLINGRYSAKGPNLDVFLQSHAGSQVRVDRGSRESVLLHNPAMTVCCSVQPYVLQELGANRAFKGRGLVARFLFAMPKSRLGFRTLQPKQVPERVETQWSDLVQSLLNIPQHHDEFNGPTALTISLSPEAYRIWRQEQRQTEKEMRPGGVWNSETGWASKYPGAVLRIAGVLHCAVCVSQGNSPADVRVTESTMESAVRIGRKIKQHSLKVFGEMGLSEDLRFASKIAEWIQRTGQTEFTKRECSRHCNSAGYGKQLDGAFGLLTERGWIRPGVQKATGASGGRPSYPFEVNPAVAELDDKTDKTPEWRADDDVSSVLSSEFGEAAAGFAGAGNGEAYAWADDLLG